MGLNSTLSGSSSSVHLISSGSAPKVNASGAVTALRQAIGLPTSKGGALNIKGASSGNSNVVEVKGLVAGTSTADVEVGGR